MANDPVTGKKIGRYELRQMIGEGGMSTVYRAYDTGLEREVALKLFRHDTFSPNIARRMIKRFDREAKALARLSHPNIVEVLDYGGYQESLYLVMKYLSGGTLKDRVKGKLGYADAAKIIVPIARALGHAHSEGVVHRDVKPANILFSKEGVPMLSDFGIAKITEDEKSISLTATNVGVGTPEYMAPEQWVNQVSPQSDIYALGMVLYELVTGIKPYAADTPTGVAIRQATEALPDPRRYTPDLPRNVSSVILKALARQPEARYATMEDFALALENLDVLEDGKPEMESSEDSALDRINDTPVIPEARRASSVVKTQRLASYDSLTVRRINPYGHHSAWMTLHIILTLVLALLIVATAMLSIEGIIRLPF
ncbi:MAG: serine/threonine protein kinase [Anaerolineae bacterium]|nr:serine/threonine protein kinase [Anaerolineae bacterium]